MAIAAMPPSASSVPGLDRPSAPRRADQSAGCRREAERVAAASPPATTVRWPAYVRSAASNSSGASHAFEGRRQLRAIQRMRSRVRLRTSSSPPRAGQADRHVVEGEPASDDRARPVIASRLSVISSTSRLKSKSRAISSRRSSASRSLVAHGRRQVARDHADGEKREQRDPVLRVGDRQRPDRRQEEEIEAQHRHDRCRDAPATGVDVAATSSTISRNDSATVV